MNMSESDCATAIKIAQSLNGRTIYDAFEILDTAKGHLQYTQVSKVIIDTKSEEYIKIIKDDLPFLYEQDLLAQ